MKTATLNGFANAVANYISREMFPPHRGVIEVQNPFGGRCLVAFGNDGYSQDARTRSYADALLGEMGEHDAVMGIDSDEGYTWAIVVTLNVDTQYAGFLAAVIEHELYVKYRESRDLTDDDGFVFARKAICDREIIQHTDGEPLTITGWESVN